MHQGSENQRWGKALPPGATQAARWMLPAIVKWGCMSGVSSSHPRCKLLHWETAVGLNTLEWINQGMAAALCRSPGWVGAPALCAPRLHCSSCQSGFAPQAQHFGTNGDLWAWVVLSKSSVPVCLRMCGRKLSILQAHPACLSSLWADQHWLISLSNWSVLCIPLKAPSKPRVKGQMSPIMKGEVAYFTTRFEKNPIYSSSGTIMASATYFILKAEPRIFGESLFARGRREKCV